MKEKLVSFLLTIGIGTGVALFIEYVVFGLIFGLKFHVFTGYFFELWFLTIPQLFISIVGAFLAKNWQKTWSAAWIGAVVGAIISVIMLLIILFTGLRIY